MYTLPTEIICGYYSGHNFKSGTITKERIVEKYELEYFTENAKYTFIDGIKHNIKKDFLLVAKPGQKRYSKLPFKTIYIKFAINNEIANLLNNLPDYFPVFDIQKIKQLFEDIILLFEENNNLLFHSKILELIDSIYKEALISVPKESKTIEYVKKAKAFIESNYNNSLSLNDIAKSVNLSPRYFHAMFLSATKITPHRYLMECRISAAKKMIWSGDYTMNEIAENCGFGCQQYFNKVFKQETGISPLKYRTQMKDNYL